jgi:hypothetical protein
MSIYSGDEDCGDEITSPDTVVLDAPANSFDAYLARCRADTVEHGSGEPVPQKRPHCPDCVGRGYVGSLMCRSCYGTGRVWGKP